VGRIASEPAYALSGRLLSDLVRLTFAVGVIMAVGVVLSPLLISLIYPSYISSVASARVLMAAVPAMVLVSWILPISLSSGKRPWIDGVIAYPAATLVLYIAVRILFPKFGELGTAASSIVSALPLIVALLGQLVHGRILRSIDACLIFGAMVAVTGSLSVLVWIIR
jgi:hypothetical protein